MSYPASRTEPSKRDLWRTPPFVTWWSARRWGPFGIDMAATAESRICEKYLGPESTHPDALAIDWADVAANLEKLGDPLHAWINPPYSRIDDWLRRAVRAQHAGLSSTLLIPAMPGERRFASISGIATEIVFIVGRLAFLDEYGTPISGNVSGSCLVHLRAYDEGSPRVVWVRRENMQAEHIQWERGEEVGHA